MLARAARKALSFTHTCFTFVVKMPQLRPSLGLSCRYFATTPVLSASIPTAMSSHRSTVMRSGG
eukprot:4387094-Pleurochrysis_carterae.AAC.1